MQLGSVQREATVPVALQREKKQQESDQLFIFVVLWAEKRQQT